MKRVQRIDEARARSAYAHAGKRGANNKAQVQAAPQYYSGSARQCFQASAGISSGTFSVVGSSEFTAGGMFQFTAYVYPSGEATFGDCPSGSGSHVFNPYDLTLKFFTPNRKHYE
jgi:hypothetical protein